MAAHPLCHLHTTISPSAGPRDNRWHHILTTWQSETFSSFSTSLKGSAGRLTRMAASGNKVAVLKLSGIIIGVVMVLYFLYHLAF
jgi:blocked-early-in-transport protein 1